MGSLGWPEIGLIILLLFLLFGPRRLPELARSIGEGIREFKKSLSASTSDVSPAAPEEKKAEQPADSQRSETYKPE